MAVRHSAAFNGVDELCLMLLDVLDQFDELKVCVAYDLDGERIDTFPGDAFLLAKCKPIYETLPGWGKDITGVRTLEYLPTQPPGATSTAWPRSSGCRSGSSRSAPTGRRRSGRGRVSNKS